MVCNELRARSAFAGYASALDVKAIAYRSTSWGCSYLLLFFIHLDRARDSRDGHASARGCEVLKASFPDRQS